MKYLIPVLLFFISNNIYSQSNQYTYDNAQRLTSIVYTNGLTYHYSYDKLGNRISQSISIGSPLPIDLISFGAEAHNCEVELKWTIGQLSNFSHFEIERSSSNSNYQQIGKVDLVQTNSYSFIDKTSNLQSNQYYNYRLKLVDIDGSYKYSNAVSVYYNCNEASELIVYPNPSENFVWIECVDAKNVLKVLNIIDMNGKVIQSFKSNESKVKINTTQLANGEYHIQANTRLGTFSQKITIIK